MEGDLYPFLLLTDMFSDGENPYDIGNVAISSFSEVVIMCYELSARLKRPVSLLNGRLDKIAVQVDFGWPCARRLCCLINSFKCFGQGLNVTKKFCPFSTFQQSV